ncbi:sugar ABC transporter permease [Halobacillus salinarum]|uniref:Sugar ABC transporter permease n=1 Tax=Halobacillus salinarum TaxID=2932257 RepID=A0ABY4EI34_9BACI|nr:sugar ABC transporter permease [Halobacillus salinarum]UOQ44136.1 sugar ABC transporter permease [Halobacillus salinarum]
MALRQPLPQEEQTSSLNDKQSRQFNKKKPVHPKPKKKKQKWNFKRTWQLHVLVLPAVIVALFFQYAPMGGLIMAFQDYKPWLGFLNSPWVGFQHFKTMFEYDDARQVIWNTLVISLLKIIFQVAVPLMFALLLNEVRKMAFKKSIQTIIYLPHFLSWVILGGILMDMLSPDGGLINQMLGFIGIDPIFFLGDNTWFRPTIIISDIWKETGFNTIVFLAAVTAVNPVLYEAAIMDGANRWKQTLYITIPAMLPIIIVVATLSLGNILNAGFDQIFNLYNPLVYQTGDIIDTYVYRVGLINGDFSYGTAVGLFKSVISFILVVIGYRLAYKYADYRIF